MQDTVLCCLTFINVFGLSLVYLTRWRSYAMRLSLTDRRCVIGFQWGAVEFVTGNWCVLFEVRLCLTRYVLASVVLFVRRPK